LPKKVRKLGLKIALSSKFKSGELLIVDQFNVTGAKTKELLNTILRLNARNALLIDNVVAEDSTVVRAANNLHKFDVLPQVGANVYDIMRKEKLILTVEAVKALEERLK
jgi:large subunit ribosomal protein L4